ncbi:MAG: DUF871 domain-containing protein [Sarcina sp.]
MSLGFSVYFGLDNTMEENIELLRKGKKYGFTRIFTSLHIPEANYEVLKKEVKEFFEIAKEYDMDIISDISPNTFKFLDLEEMDLKGLKDIGVKTIRIDFGYTEEDISKMSKNTYGIKIQLNASTITEEFFRKLDRFNPDYDNIDALHNFYPRKNTGLSKEIMVEKNQLLESKGIKRAAFVQSNFRKRSPLKDGLPTLENHRGKDISISTNELFAYLNNSVFIGDSLPSDEELRSLSKFKDDAIKLDIEIFTKDKCTERILKEVHTSRIDEARDAIRSSESRLLLNGDIIKKEIIRNRKKLEITIDNESYKRYMGEMQILKTDLEKDERVNIVGRVLEKDEYLLKYIRNGKRYYFNIIKEV